MIFTPDEALWIKELTLEQLIGEYIWFEVINTTTLVKKMYGPVHLIDVNDNFITVGLLEKTPVRVERKTIDCIWYAPDSVEIHSGT